MAELFADLLGQPAAVALLSAALERRRLAPAYLFSGPDGVGRRLAALRFLEGVLAGPQGCPSARRRLASRNHPDLLWLEPTVQHQGQLIPASEAIAQGLAKRGVAQLRLEQVRGVSRFLARRPLESPRGLVVIEAVEAMAEGAANALLKTLEEPGDGLLVLLSAAPERLLATIRSRCQQVPFRRLEPAVMARVLERLGEPVEGQGAGGVNRVEPPGLLALAAGAPGALLEHRRQWQGLPEGLAERLLELPADPLEALALARDLSEALELDQQLWLLDWWQWCLWVRRPEPAWQRRIERLRSQLRGFVQPRLAWEVALLEIGSASGALEHGRAR